MHLIDQNQNMHVGVPLSDRLIKHWTKEGRECFQSLKYCQHKVMQLQCVIFKCINTWLLYENFHINLISYNCGKVHVKVTQLLTYMLSQGHVFYNKQSKQSKALFTWSKRNHLNSECSHNYIVWWPGMSNKCMCTNHTDTFTFKY